MYLLVLHFVGLHRCCVFYTLKACPSTNKEYQLPLLDYSHYCSGLKANLQYLWRMPVLCMISVFAVIFFSPALLCKARTALSSPFRLSLAYRTTCWFSVVEGWTELKCFTGRCPEWGKTLKSNLRGKFWMELTVFCLKKERSWGYHHCK